MVAKSVVDVILGEAGGKTRAERFADMVAIASAIENRSQQTGRSALSIVSAKGQFDAYGKSLPAGVEAYRDLAQQALDYVRDNGPTHRGTYYATPAATKGLPSGLKHETQTTAHVFKSDPESRSIATSTGFVTPTGRTSVPDTVMAASARPYSDIVPPTMVQTVNVTPPAVAPTPTGRPSLGMAALAPNGLNIAQTNAQAIAGLHPSFRERAQDFLDTAKMRGLDLEVAQGYRSNATQAGLYAQGRTAPGSVVTNAQPGRSHHNFGLALDVVPAGLKDTFNWSPNDSRWGEVGRLANEKGLTWGGNFKSIVDMPHVQAISGSTKEARSAPVDKNGYPMFSPETDLAIRDSFVPTPTARPDPIATMTAPVAAVERAALPSISPALGAAAARSMPSAPPTGITAPAVSARAAEMASMAALGRSVPSVAPALPSIVNAPPVAPAPLSAPAPMAAPSMGRVTSSTGLFAPTLTAPNFSGLSPKSVQTTTVAPPQEASKNFSAATIGKGALAGAITAGIPGAIAGAIAAPVRGMLSDALGKAFNRAPDVPSYNRMQNQQTRGILGNISRGIPSFGAVFGGLGGLLGGAGPGFGISASPGDYGVTSAGGFGPSAGAGIGMGPGYGYGWGSGFSIGLGEDNKNQ